MLYWDQHVSAVRGPPFWIPNDRTVQNSLSTCVSGDFSSTFETTAVILPHHSSGATFETSLEWKIDKLEWCDEFIFDVLFDSDAKFNEGKADFTAISRNLCKLLVSYILHTNVLFVCQRIVFVTLAIFIYEIYLEFHTYSDYDLLGVA